MTGKDELDFAGLQDALAGVYSLESRLGQGGMGVVYLGRDVALDRPVAIKVLRPELAARPDQRERFLAEARTGARLSHPLIVPIFAVAEAAGWVYFVMGVVAGESLGERVRRAGPVPTSEGERILREVGWALAYAHAMGILHRDVTLDNILIERSTARAMLVDFGIAAEIDRAGEASLVGTPAYLAPELIHGDPPSVQSDVYALGITAWAMLAGRLPFVGDDAAAVLLQQVQAPVPSLASAAPGASPRLVAAIERCLAKDPTARHDTVEAFIATLERPGTVPALAPPLHRWVTRWERIRPAWAFAMPMIAMLSVESFVALLDRLTTGVMGYRFPMPFPGDPGLMMGILRPVVLIPAAALLLQGMLEVRELRRVVRSGYGIEDLRVALRRHTLEAPGEAPGLLGRVIHDVSWLTVIGMIVLAYVALHIRWFVGGSNDEYFAFAQVILDMMRWGWVILWTAFGASFVMRVSPIRLHHGKGLGTRFWNSRLGSWLARLAGFGLGRNEAPAHTLHRPTELVLDLAIDDLWGALPDTMRRGLLELPAVADSLRQRVGELKELTRQLEAPALADVPEAAALRARLAIRQEAGITALERLRLQLAGLSGEAVPTGALTEQLRDARALEGELLTELAGHPSLKRLLKRKSTPRSPTPTPLLT